MLKGLLPFIKSKEIESLCQRLGKEITEDYKNLNPLIISPLKGSIFFLNQLLKHLDFPLSVDFVSINCLSGICYIQKDIAISPEGRHVLIVEEIIDSGKKTQFLKERILLSNPSSIKIANLLDKSSRRELALHPDYSGKSIDDRFVVGYGMDAEELGRNYKDIYTFAQ